MKQLTTLLFLFTLCLVSLGQTCDLVLAGYTPSAIEEGIHTFVIQFPNTENCGCNDYTQTDGSTCDQSGTTHVQNNETVSHIVMGLHYVDEETGLDLGENTDCTSTTFHPGWSYVLNINEPSDGWASGASTTIGIDVPYSWECILDNPIEGYCWEVVIWQINLSQTATYDDFPDAGWSAGIGGNATQMYPDIDLSNNRISFCPDPVVTDTVYVYQLDTIFIQLPPDTITEYLYDTLIVTVPEVIYDTLTLVDVVDSLIYLTDTLYVELPPDTIYVPWEWYIYDTTYIYLTDTLIEYVQLPNDTITLTQYDTTYVELPPDTIFQLDVDTLYLTQTDTIVQEIIVLEYVYLTDTLTEYIYEEIWIDCNTGLPCGEEPPEAPGCSVFVPNSFTPNNDGWNDGFYAVTEGDCWDEWELSVYNRWGDRIWATPYINERWYGQVNSGEHYASDGVYVWVIKAKGPGESLDLQGTVTLFR